MWRRNKFTFTRFRGSSTDAHLCQSLTRLNFDFSVICLKLQTMNLWHIKNKGANCKSRGEGSFEPSYLDPHCLLRLCFRLDPWWKTSVKAILHNHLLYWTISCHSTIKLIQSWAGQTVTLEEDFVISIWPNFLWLNVVLHSSHTIISPC